jgi:hypothetical protein
MIRIYKVSNDGTVTVVTDCLNADDFERDVADVIIDYIGRSCDVGTMWPDDLAHDLPQILEGAFAIMCKLRGYKTDKVGEQRLFYSGRELPPVDESRPFAERK